MSMSVSLSTNYPLPGVVGTRSSAKGDESKDVETDFLKIARQSPIERMRSAILKKLGLTEESLAAMDPQTRAAIEKTIREEIAKQLKANGDDGRGRLADLQA